jgi:CRISPR-associated protein Cst2
VSTTPWPGTISAHFASPGSNPAVSTDNSIPYQCEVHDTRYQYTFALTPDALLRDKKIRTGKTLLAIQNLCRPGGNHARFLFDFAPEAVVLRWTTDPAPRIMFCFEQGEDGQLSIARLVARVRGGDIDPKELVVGTVENVDGLDKLRELNVSVFDGVKKAFANVLARVNKSVKD